ncbi:uncharacterized protein TNCV_4227821 [Trichonephila clavipes]|nr:uncharacterized protein TNCV_4227821 [Trichonephila clavipes]
MNFMNISHDPNNGRSYTDSFKLSLKAVLLHNGNILPFIPIGHSVHVMETDANVKLHLELIKDEDYKWWICGDLKIIALLMGMQLGSTKYCSFLCSKSALYTRQKAGEKSEILREREENNILLPPLHIKLALMDP